MRQGRPARATTFPVLDIDQVRLGPAGVEFTHDGTHPGGLYPTGLSCGFALLLFPIHPPAPETGRLSKTLKFVLPLLILALAIGIFIMLKTSAPKQASPEIQERVWRVEVEPANPSTQSAELELYGRVQTPDLLRAAAPAAAWVVEVAVQDGDRVQAGDLLVRLDERDFLPRIAQAEAEVAQLEAEIDSERNRHETDRLALEQEQRLLELARDGVERQERLKTQRVGAEQALDEAEQAEALQALAVSEREMDLADHPARLRALESRLASAQARLDSLRLEYERSRVRAPYDGIVSAVEVTVGDRVGPGEELVRLYELDSLEVAARIPAPYQSELTGILAQADALPAIAQVAGRQLPLRLSRIAGEAGPSGVDGLFEVLDGRELLRLGQTLTLRLKRPAKPDLIAVPFRALHGGDRLYTLVEGRLRGIDVERFGSRLGATGQERLLVRAPELQAGDLIVTTHLPNAIEGLRVMQVDAKGDQTAATATTESTP